MVLLNLDILLKNVSKLPQGYYTLFQGQKRQISTLTR